MNQEQRIDYLVNFLRDEYERYRQIQIPDTYSQKQELYRSLVNIRPPLPVDPAYLEVQDQYLLEETRRKGIVNIVNIPTSHLSNSISLWQGDITSLQVDAIVNAANSELLGCFIPGHHCIDNAIHTAAGVQLRLECDEIMKKQHGPEETGNAKITKGYNLPAKHVLHTVGPIVQGQPTSWQREQLANCYRACLVTAEENNLDTVAFCCISTGVFAFPKQLAAEIAVTTVYDYLDQRTFGRIIFNVFTDEDRIIYEKLLMA